jgi:hypothetical protein
MIFRSALIRTLQKVSQFGGSQMGQHHPDSDEQQ